MVSFKSPTVTVSRDNHEDQGETTPLLAPQPTSRLGQTTHSESNPEPRHKSTTIMWIILFGVLLVSLGDQLMDSPQTRIYEAIICYRYYEKTDPSKLLVGREAVRPGAIGGVAEMWCKTGAVQNELASLGGWQQLFDGIPGLLLAVPVGWAADKIGRKPIVLLGVVAFAARAIYIQLVTWFWQGFDIRAVWFSTIFASIGGGGAATTSVFFVLISDITTEANRAEAFVRIMAFNLLASLAMPPLAALLMEINPWIPNLAGTLLELLTLVCFMFIPETLHYQQFSSSSTVPPLPITPTEIVHDDDYFATANIGDRAGLFDDWTLKLRRSAAFLTSDWRIPALIVPFSIHILIASLGQLLLQYVSTRYEVKLSKAILITTIRAGVITLLLFVVLPYVSTLLTDRLRLSGQRKDLYLVRTSLILYAIGWLLTGLSPNLVLLVISLAISALASGLAPLLRSFLTSLIEKHHIARVYAIISLVDTLGSMVGAPLMAGLFQRGLTLGGYWIGLPFYFIGLLTACFTVLLFAVNLRKSEDQFVPVEEDCQDGIS